MAKKIKKAILAGLATYAASKMMGKGSLKGNKYLSTDRILDKVPKEPLVDAISGGTKFKPDVLGGADTRGRDPTWWEKFWHRGRTQKKEGGAISATVWKKHGGAIKTEYARVGKLIKAAQGTHVKSGTMLKARHGTEVRTMGSNPHVPTGGSGSIATKLNGQVKFKTF